MGFKRGQSGEALTGNGEKGKIKKWLDQANLAKASCYYFDDPDDKNVLYIDVEDNIVLDKDEQFIIRYEFRNVTGSITILSELCFEEIRSRIQKHLENKFSECKGKTIEEQEKIIFGDPDSRSIIIRKFQEEWVKAAEEYTPQIDKENPKSLEFELIQECLQPFLDSIDAYGVSLRDYQKTIKNYHLN